MTNQPTVPPLFINYDILTNGEGIITEYKLQEEPKTIEVASQMIDFDYPRFYILTEDKRPIPVADVIAWAHVWEESMRRVAYAEISTPDGNIRISTVFLGIDHGFPFLPSDEPYEPVLWETMIFGGPHDQYQCRYTSHEAALAGHQHALWIAENPQAEGEDSP